MAEQSQEQGLCPRPCGTHAQSYLGSCKTRAQPTGRHTPALHSMGATVSSALVIQILGDPTLQACLGSDPLLLGFLLLIGFFPAVLWDSPPGLPFADLCHVRTLLCWNHVPDEVWVTPIVSCSELPSGSSLI